MYLNIFERFKHLNIVFFHLKSCLIFDNFLNYCSIKSPNHFYSEPKIENTQYSLKKEGYLIHP